MEECGWNLIAKRFAGTGRKNSEHVFAAEDCFQNLALSRSEFFDAKASCFFFEAFPVVRAATNGSLFWRSGSARRHLEALLVV